MYVENVCWNYHFKIPNKPWAMSYLEKQRLQCRCIPNLPLRLCTQVHRTVANPWLLRSLFGSKVIFKLAQPNNKYHFKSKDMLLYVEQSLASAWHFHFENLKEKKKVPRCLKRLCTEIIQCNSWQQTQNDDKILSTKGSINCKLIYDLWNKETQLSLAFNGSKSVWFSPIIQTYKTTCSYRTQQFVSWCIPLKVFSTVSFFIFKVA